MVGVLAGAVAVVADACCLAVVVAGFGVVVFVDVLAAAAAAAAAAAEVVGFSCSNLADEPMVVAVHVVAVLVVAV